MTRIRPHAGWLAAGLALLALAAYRADAVGAGLALLVGLAGALLVTVSLLR